MSLSFKKFMQFVDLDGEVGDDQINEIFGLFRNNAKVDALKKEREKLKGMSAAKKAELDQALKDFASGKKPKAGSGQFTDWDEVVGGADKTALDREDKTKRKEAGSAKNKVGHNFYEARSVNVKAFKVEIPPGITDSAIWDFIEDQSVVTIEDFERKGKVVYFYPHFDHDYDPHMAGAMQAAFNRYLKANHLD